MAKLDFIPVTGYSVARCCIDEKYQIITTPILAIYVERHACAVEALTAGGEVIELNLLCVLKLPDGTYCWDDEIFYSEDEWRDWVRFLEGDDDDVCAKCREKERIERGEAFRSNGS